MSSWVKINLDELGHGNKKWKMAVHEENNKYNNEILTLAKPAEKSIDLLVCIILKCNLSFFLCPCFSKYSILKCVSNFENIYDTHG